MTITSSRATLFTLHCDFCKHRQFDPHTVYRSSGAIEAAARFNRWEQHNGQWRCPVCQPEGSSRR